MSKDKNDTAIPFYNEIQSIRYDFEPHNFSKRMCASIENQTDINSSIIKIIQNSLKENVSIQKTIKDIMDKHIVYKLGLWLNYPNCHCNNDNYLSSSKK